MIINNAPANDAVLSNVGQIGEFRIRNSAKAFSILSSGLYANKIRAIVRELSCNAVDSHTAAGKSDVPFDVHLPSQLEPWFSIRDYGTGLSAEQVTNIYTTYFESTKTESNEFIGALGLGSKSPFSYTDNFTVTAIKDGKKGIYSAFINAEGVPSIAQMMTEDTTEPAGVEVKFSVNDYWDFNKFADEARSVYTHFKLRPVISGGNNSEFKFIDIEYETRDIIPGVHSKANSRYANAVMGNIAYPIDLPNADANLGELVGLLNCGLEMHFAIGELDFQASREGLSYIPQTIDSIKSKLEAVNAQLAIHIAAEADAIENLWERAFFLEEKKGNRLWTSAVNKYVTDSKFKLMQMPAHGYNATTKPFTIKVDDLAKRFNISIRAFNKNRGTVGVNTLAAQHNYDRATKDKDGNYLTWMEWSFSIAKNLNFVINDTKVGAAERAKHHFRVTSNSNDPYTRSVYVLEAADKDKAINAKAFFRALSNPPTSMIMNASDLTEKERKTSTGGVAKDVTILSLQSRNQGGYYRSREKVWRDAGKASDFDAKTTYYYIPLSGFNIDCERLKNQTGTGLANLMETSGLQSLNVRVYGVRKGDIETIKTKKNWINIETHIEKVLKNITPAEIQSMAMGTISPYNLVRYDEAIAKLVKNKKSPWLVVTKKVKDAIKIECEEHNLKSLCNLFDVKIDIDAAKQQINDDSANVFKRYPLLSNVMNRCDDADIAEYINAIDALKGV
jgi:hypothetical protein